MHRPEISSSYRITDRIDVCNSVLTCMCKSCYILQPKTWNGGRRLYAIVQPTKRPYCIQRRDAAAAWCCHGSRRWSRGGRRFCHNEDIAILPSAYRSSGGPQIKLKKPIETMTIISIASSNQVSFFHVPLRTFFRLIQHLS